MLVDEINSSILEYPIFLTSWSKLTNNLLTVDLSEFTEGIIGRIPLLERLFFPVSNPIKG
nr:MAG TPA: hypothetical protein [Caudoviricetes sp.]